MIIIIDLDLNQWKKKRLTAVVFFLFLLVLVCKGISFALHYFHLYDHHHHHLSWTIFFHSFWIKKTTTTTILDGTKTKQYGQQERKRMNKNKNLKICKKKTICHPTIQSIHSHFISRWMPWNGTKFCYKNFQGPSVSTRVFILYFCWLICFSLTHLLYISERFRLDHSNNNKMRNWSGEDKRVRVSGTCFYFQF